MILDAAVRGVRYVVETQAADSEMIVRAGGATSTVRLEPVTGAECWRLVVDGQAVPVRVRADGGDAVVTIGSHRVRVSIRRALPVPSRRSAAPGADERVEVRTPMPGLIVAVPSATGQDVDAGAVLVVVEAMKMQMDVPAPQPGRVEEIRVRTGQEVAGGQVLAVLRRAAT